MLNNALTMALKEAAARRHSQRSPVEKTGSALGASVRSRENDSHPIEQSPRIQNEAKDYLP